MTPWILLGLWLGASALGMICLLLALRHLRKARQACGRAITISEGMIRDIEEARRLAR